MLLNSEKNIPRVSVFSSDGKPCIRLIDMKVVVVLQRQVVKYSRTKAHINSPFHYRDVIMSTMASQITSLTIAYSTVYSGADRRKHQSSASLAFVWGSHRRPVNSPHKWPVTQKMFALDDVIMLAPGRCGSVFKNAKTEHMLRVDFLNTSWQITLSWMHQNNLTKSQH